MLWPEPNILSSQTLKFQKKYRGLTFVVNTIVIISRCKTMLQTHRGGSKADRGVQDLDQSSYPSVELTETMKSIKNLSKIILCVCPLQERTDQ